MPPAKPGQHQIILGSPHHATLARALGWQLRDSITILSPGPLTDTAFLLRRPLERTVAETALADGQGTLNIDACRVSTQENLNGGAYQTQGRHTPMTGDPRQGPSLGMFAPGRSAGSFAQPPGRWPSNLLLVHSPGCQQVGEKKVKSDHAYQGPGDSRGGLLNRTGAARKNPHPGYADAEGKETVASWQCEDGCPVAALDRHGTCRSAGLYPSDSKVRRGSTNLSPTQGTLYADTGSASRFYPQFLNFLDALAWLNTLTSTPKP